MKRLLGERKSEARKVVDQAKDGKPSRVDALAFLLRAALLAGCVACVAIVSVSMRNLRDTDRSGNCPLTMRIGQSAAITYGSTAPCMITYVGFVRKSKWRRTMFARIHDVLLDVVSCARMSLVSRSLTVSAGCAVFLLICVFNLAKLAFK